MSTPSPGRGGSTEDARLFGPGARPALRAASEEVAWLLERGYPAETALRVVGDHHQLHARQRLALTRSTSSLSQRAARRAKEVAPEAAAGLTIAVDGFNLIVTLEVALSGGLVLRGMEGALRDLAGLRGTYHLLPETTRAVDLLGAAVAALSLRAVHVFLDAPVRSSGKLADLLRERSAGWAAPVEVSLVPDADPVLARQSCVVSSDAVVLDLAPSWLNLGAWILATHLPDVPVIDLAAETTPP